MSPTVKTPPAPRIDAATFPGALPTVPPVVRGVRFSRRHQALRRLPGEDELPEGALRDWLRGTVILLGRQERAQARMTELLAQRQAAFTADRDALHQTMLDGARAPESRLAAVDSELAEAAHQVQALGRGLDRRGESLAAVIAESGPEVAAILREQREAADLTAEQASTIATEAGARAEQLGAVERWATTGRWEAPMAPAQGTVGDASSSARIPHSTW